MAWCRQATIYCLSQCWPRSMSPYGITRPQWVKELAKVHCWLEQLVMVHTIAPVWQTLCRTGHGISLVYPEYSDFSTRIINPFHLGNGIFYANLANTCIMPANVVTLHVTRTSADIKLTLFMVVSQHHEGVILGLSQWVKLWLLEITTSRLSRHSELMVHAGCGQCACPIRPTACIVTVYCLNISETASFTAVCSKRLIVYGQGCICANFNGKNRTIAELKGSKVNMFCKENCLFSLRGLVRGIPTRAKFTPNDEIGWFLSSLGVNFIKCTMGLIQRSEAP